MMNRRWFVGSLGFSALFSQWVKARGLFASDAASDSSLNPAVRAGDEWAGSIGPIGSLPASRNTYELCEFKVPVRGEEAVKLNPYRAAELALDAEFTLPSGKTMRVPGFYAQDFVLNDHRGTPVEGSAGWRVRFSGPEPGQYQAKVDLRVRGKFAASREIPSFTLGPSSSHGMIRVSRASPRYMEHDDGTSFFAIGQDVCWTTDTTKAIPGVTAVCPTLPWDEAFARWFGRMGQNGANWARVFMKPNFYLEAGEPWTWSLEAAWRLDQVLEFARRNGIHICLCFNPERSDAGTCYKGFMDLMRASNTAWGRLLSSQRLGFDQFFTNGLTREMYRDKIRYVVGRWGYSPQIFSWELWNELETIESPEGVGAWFREMTAYLRSVDPWRHLIKSSEADVWAPEYWGKDNGDLNDIHPYFGWSGEEGPKNLGAFIPEYSSGIYATGRPFLVAETGIAREVATKYGLAGDLADKDATCFHLHEALWGGLFSGAAGTGMIWYWDEHTDLHNAYHRFQAVANFVADIEFNRENFTRGEKACVSTDQLRIFELIGNHSRLLWIRHRDLSWYGLAVDKRNLKPVDLATVTLTGVQAGSYRVEFWNPEEGKLLRTGEFVAKMPSLEIPLPEIEKEIAVKVRSLHGS